MPEGLGSRFAFEAAFLILLAVVSGLAGLRPLLIVAVMAGAWAIVSAIEWLAWRAGPRPFLPVASARAEEPEGDEGILVPEEELQQEPLTTVLPPAESEPAGDAGRE